MSQRSIAFAAWSSAIRRPPTSPKALHRLTEAYLALGLDQEAQKNAAVLGYNFPSSPWYLDSYALLNGGTSQ